MASGDPVVQVLEIWPPQTLFAVIGRRAGGSAPAEGINVWAFDAATIWYLDFLCTLQGYGGGGLTFTIPWTAATATTGVCRLGIAIRRRLAGSGGDDSDTAKTYDFNDADTTVAVNAGIEIATDITFTDGVDMDSWANNERALVRVRRNASHANDTMAGNAELWGLIGRET